MKTLIALISLAGLAACSGGVFGGEPGPITDEQFAELQEECGLDDASLATGNRTSSFTTDDGVPVTVTNEAESEGEKTVVLGRQRSEREMVGVILCLAEFQDRTGAEFTTDAGAAGLGF